MRLAMPIFVFYFYAQSILFAQTKNKLRFNNIDQVGFITANKPNSVKLETINDVRLNTWSAGIGLGIDWQAVRSIPLFLDIRKYFGNKNNNWFMYGDAGGNFWWKNENKAYFNEVSSNYSTTFFAEAGVGYSISKKNKHQILLSLGYGNKRIEHDYTYIIFSDIYPGPNFLVTHKDRLNMNRLIIKAAFRL